jgi:hypothetical protein
MLIDAGDDAVAQVETLESLAQEETPKPEPKEEPKQDEALKPEEKRPTGYQRKLAAKDAELAEVRAEIARIKAEKESLPKDTSKGRPNYEEYEKAGKSNEQYFEDLADWKANQTIEAKLTERETKAKEAEMRTEAQKRQREYQAKAAEFSKSATDFNEVTEAYDGPWNNTIAQALLESDMGPQVAYHLAKNPEEAEKLEGMNYAQVNRFFGRIEASLESQKPPETKVTKAPPPLNVPRGTGQTSTLDPFNNHDMSAEQWRAYKAKLKQR